MVVLSFISSLFSGPGLLNLLVRVLIWAILIKYAYEVLKTTARGDLTPPKINAETISNDFQVVFKQIGLYIIMGIVYFWFTAKLGIFFGIMLLIFIVLSIPSMIILLATTDSILRAINPTVFTRLAFRIGWDYLLMYFFLILLLFAPAVLGQYILKYLPSVSHIFLFSFAKSFYTLISYHLMGYVVLQYHAEIGYKVDYEDFKDPNAEQEEEDAVTEIMARVNPLITEGKLDEAINLIQELTKTEGITDLALSERYYNMLKIKKQTPVLLKHCVTHLDLLAKENKKTEACEIYRSCLAQESTFTPTPFTLFKLAGWCNEYGDSKEAIQTYNRLLQLHPEDHLVPKAYFRAAQIFYDRLMDPPRAKNILSGLIKKYPDHEIIPHAKNYLKHMTV